MDIEMLTTFISSVGFPIGVAAYLLLHGNKASMANTDAINKMASAVENNTKLIEYYVSTLDKRKSDYIKRIKTDE